MGKFKYLEKYPSKTNPGKFIYKYDDGSGSSNGNKVANSLMQTTAQRHRASTKKKVQSANRQKRLGMNRNYVYKDSRLSNQEGYQYSTRNNARKSSADYYHKDTNDLIGRSSRVTTNGHSVVRTESGILDRAARKVGSYASERANAVKSYASSTVSSLKSTGSKAISSGKSFINSLFGKKNKPNVRYDDYPY